MRIAVAALLMIGLVALAYRPQRDPMPQFPRIMLWAWERPEKLDFINPREIGVAFLARTIHIDGAQVTVRPRLQPLLVAPGTAIMAVVRIESEDALYATHREVERAILEATDPPGVLALQVDYDAKATARDFYRTVLRDLRNALPSGMPLPCCTANFDQMRGSKDRQAGARAWRCGAWSYCDICDGEIVQNPRRTSCFMRMLYLWLCDT